jgi:hypothetical protein
MQVQRSKTGHVMMEFSIDEARKLAKALRRNARDMSNGGLELASLLSEAGYNARNDFRQPAHAFDEQAPRAPSTRI